MVNYMCQRNENMVMTMSITNNCNSSKCSNCGECCSEFLPITKKEYYVIKEYLENHPEIKEQKHINKKDMHLLCPFRDNENKCCTIYPVRPLVCKQFLCLKNKEHIESTKIKLHKRAYFNHMDSENNMVNLVSFHALFFNDINWEAQALYLLVDKNINAFKYLSGVTFIDYKNIIKQLEDKNNE